MTDTKLSKTVQILSFPVARSKGRNGPFIARSLTIRALPEIDNGPRTVGSPAVVTIEAHSQRPGTPLCLTLSPPDALVLAEQLQAAVLATFPVCILETAREGPAPTVQDPETRPKFYECDGCSFWHPLGWTGECRDNAYRFTSEQLDVLFPDKNADGWPDWVEAEEGDEYAAAK